MDALSSLNLLGGWSTLTECLLREAVNYAADSLRAFDVVLMMMAMQRLLTIALPSGLSAMCPKPKLIGW
jgi:hypothetical protein